MLSCAPSHQPELSLPFLHGYSSLPCFFEIIAILNCPQVNVNRGCGALPRSFLSDLAPLRFTPTGNFFASSLPHAMTSLCFTSTGNAPSCEIVKKNIGYTFPHVFRAPKRGFHSYIDFLLSIGHGQGMDSVFWLYPPFFFSFYKIWFS